MFVCADVCVQSQDYFDKAIFTVGPLHLFTVSVMITLPALQVPSVSTCL